MKVSASTTPGSVTVGFVPSVRLPPKAIDHIISIS